MSAVNIIPKLLSTEEFYNLIDLQTITTDIKFAKYCFENFDCNNLFRLQFLPDRQKDYAFATAGLVHYRRAFNTGTRTYKINAYIEKEGAERSALHKRLIDIADKQIAHFASGYERISPAISVAIDQTTGEASIRGISGNAVFASLMSEQTRLDAISHFQYLLSAVIAPLECQLETVVLQQAASLTSGELKDLPDGFPPHQDDPLKRPIRPRNLKA
jgi:hypothetical protein